MLSLAWRIGAACLALTALFAVGAVIWESADNSGQVIGSTELAHQARVKALLKDAQGQLNAQAFVNAANLFKQALALEPLNQTGRNGLEDAQRLKLAQERLAQAEQLAQNQDDAKALVALAAMPQETPFSAAAVTLQATLRNRLAEQQLELAKEACRLRNWYGCQETAASALVYDDENVEGQALLAEAEDVLNAEHKPFAVAYPERQIPSLKRRYPDAEVREAVLRYASGDVQAAERRLVAFARRPGAKDAHLVLQAVQQLVGEAEREAKINSERAIGLWEDALRKATQLVPQQHPNAASLAVRQRLVAALWARGNMAFERGNYQEAANAWRQGLSWMPQHRELLDAMAKLENRASALLADVATQVPLAADGCRKLADIIAMTANDSAVHRAAESKHRSCK